MIHSRGGKSVQTVLSPFQKGLLYKEIFGSSSFLIAQTPFKKSIGKQVTYSELDDSETDGSTTLDDSNSFLSPYRNLPKAQENKYKGIFSYFIIGLYVVCTHQNRFIEAILMSALNIQSLCCKSKGFPYINAISFLNWLTLSCSNYPYLEQISMGPKMFEPLRFDYMLSTLATSSGVSSHLKQTLVCRNV